MIEFLDIINVVGVLGATAVSTITLFTTKKLQKSKQQVDVMSTKRSERIDKMREYSANVLSCGKQFLHGLDDKQTKIDLIRWVDKFISLLQYEYPHDVEVMDDASEILKICLDDDLDKKKLEQKLHDFWAKCDVYVGVEYERLKAESSGAIHGSGKVDSETKTFEDIHKDLISKQNGYIKKTKKN